MLIPHLGAEWMPLVSVMLMAAGGGGFYLLMRWLTRSPQNPSPPSSETWRSVNDQPPGA